ATSKKFKYTCIEEYTDLNVTITVDNKANWSPLYIILKDGENLITPAEGALVEGNKYTISGDYIGSSLSYQFVSGDKQSDPAFVTISKNGATVTLEENVVKLYFQLDTANAKQWWGNTSKIHVWNTNTSFDTSWPGTTMTSEGNYTWSVVVPSELVGKTINFLIHNGNNWQSKDSKVTIKAEGVTVTGSSIGVE
ncbi:MAG: starch-binding protein, partial [Alistipes sp.]|nr:starch-binding protein [Alistipes sp.]